MFNSGSRRSMSSLPGRVSSRRVPSTEAMPDPCCWHCHVQEAPLEPGSSGEALGTTHCRLPAAAICHAGDWDTAGLSCAGATRIPEPAEPAQSHPLSLGLSPKSGGFDRIRMRGESGGGLRHLLAHPGVPGLPAGWQE